MLKTNILTSGMLFYLLCYLIAIQLQMDKI